VKSGGERARQLSPFVCEKNGRRNARRMTAVKSPSLGDVREAIEDEKKLLGYLQDCGILTKPSCPCKGKKMKVC